MKVSITNTSIKLGPNEVRCETYYLHNEENKNLSFARIIKKIIEQWVAAIKDLDDETHELYLPFSLDDEWVECFRVTSDGSTLIFEVVRVDAAGWQIDVSDLKDFIRTGRSIRKKLPGVFGIYERGEIIRALSEAEVHETKAEG